MSGREWRQSRLDGTWHTEAVLQLGTRSVDANVLIEVSGGREPSSATMGMLLRIEEQFCDLWQQIAERIAETHPRIGSVSDVTSLVRELSVMLDDTQRDRWELAVSFARRDHIAVVAEMDGLTCRHVLEDPDEFSSEDDE